MHAESISFDFKAEPCCCWFLYRNWSDTVFSTVLCNVSFCAFFFLFSFHFSTRSLALCVAFSSFILNMIRSFFHLVFAFIQENYLDVYVQCTASHTLEVHNWPNVYWISVLLHTPPHGDCQPWTERNIWTRKYFTFDVKHWWVPSSFSMRERDFLNNILCVFFCLPQLHS